MQQSQLVISAPAPATSSSAITTNNGGVGDEEEAPPKQVAQAMERLGRAARLIADIRLGADRLLEALFIAYPNNAGGNSSSSSSERVGRLILQEDTAMRQHFLDLRDLGRQLEESGVLNGARKARGDSWGLHMPLVCPDGAVVAYAWKRQLAGQAGASAVDRTRLALKAFTDQKKRFFPHLEDELHSQLRDGELGSFKKHCGSQRLISNDREPYEGKTLSEILKNVEQEIPNMKISTYQRLDWLKRATLLASQMDEDFLDTSKEQNLHNMNKLRPVSATAPVDQIAVIELLVPSIFRALVSLHPAGSTDPDAVAFFSPTEGGGYIHARGLSKHHVFRHVTEHADKALQYFVSVEPNRALSLLLRWIGSYQSLFTEVCSKCGRLLMMDKSLALLLPPVHRSYTATSSNSGSLEQNHNLHAAYHIGCSSYDI